MPDIMMCTGERCPDKNFCYRFMAIPKDRGQKFFHELPYDFEEKLCKSFWRLKLGDEIRKNGEIS